MPGIEPRKTPIRLPRMIERKQRLYSAKVTHLAPRLRVLPSALAGFQTMLRISGIAKRPISTAMKLSPPIRFGSLKLKRLVP